MDELADVTITAPSPEWLANFTRDLVNERLVACGNILPAIRSIYAWDNKVEDEEEALVILHTRTSLIPQIIERTLHAHPYDTPQVLALPVIDASPDYRDWVLASTDDRPVKASDSPAGFTST